MQTQALDYVIPLLRALEVPAARVGNKAANLARMKAAGFSVPDAVCIPATVHAFFERTGTVPAEVGIAISEFMRSLGGRVAVRSSASCEDSSDSTMAGVFETRFVSSPSDLLAALIAVYEQARGDSVNAYLRLHGKSPADVQMGVLVQRCIEADVSGVIYTDAAAGRTLIEYVDGPGQALVDGERHGSSIVLDRNGLPVDFSGLALDVAVTRQLSSIAASIGCLFSSRQDIEFAVQGREVFVLQARPLPATVDIPALDETPRDTLHFVQQYVARLARREQEEFRSSVSVFSDANYSELLPRPTEMDIGVYTYIFTGLDGVPGATQRARREMGYRNEQESVGIIAPIGGRAYFSMARNAALYQAAFPDTKEEYFKVLVAHYLDAVVADPEKASYPQMGLYLQDPTESDLERLFPGRERHYVEAQAAFNRGIGAFARQYCRTFGETVLPAQADHLAGLASSPPSDTNAALSARLHLLLEHLRLHTCVAFVKIARLGFYYSQRLLNELKTTGLDEREAQAAFSRLTQGLKGSCVTDANLNIACAADEGDALAIAKRMFGHTSSGEMLELRHPLLQDVPGALEAYVAAIRCEGRYADEHKRQQVARQQAERDLLRATNGVRQDELLEVVRNCQTYMGLRETAKYSLSAEYAYIKRTLQAVAARSGLSEADVYFLYPREVEGVLAQPEWFAHLIRGRRRQWNNYPQLALPHVIYSNRLSELGLRGELEFDEVCLRGRFLASGPRFKGVVVNIETHTSIRLAAKAIAQIRSRQQQVVLVASQLNLSHDPLIYQADGLVIENAGLVSHGAQRAREIGRGAVGGIRVAALPDGALVDFDPASATVNKLQSLSI